MPGLMPPKPSSQTARAGHAHGQLRTTPRGSLQSSGQRAQDASASVSQGVQSQPGAVLRRLMCSVLNKEPVASQPSGASDSLRKDTWRFGHRKLGLPAGNAAVPATLGCSGRLGPEHVLHQACRAPRPAQVRSTTWPNNSLNLTRYGSQRLAAPGAGGIMPSAAKRRPPPRAG
jgi:hypothetical protein